MNANREAWLTAAIVLDPVGCWTWPWAKGPCGYGRMAHRGKARPAHRVIYERLIGSIPPGLTLDHLCRNRACVNPGHMEPVTLAENIRRGTSPSAKAAQSTACPKGHPYSHIDSRGGRVCRTCRNDWNRAYRARGCRRKGS